MTVHCTCLEVHGEDWGCPSHGVDAVVQRLRDLAAAKHDDLSIGDDAADIIEDLRDRLNAQLSGHRLSAKEGTSNLLRATTAEAEAKAMREALERAEAALEHIVQWSEAYPLKAFHEPDFAKVRELLAAGGIEVGAVSASNMRHVVTEVGAIARRALGGTDAK